MIGANKNFAATTPPIVYSAFASPSNAFANGPPGGLTTNQITMNVSGGVEPYSYSWVKLSGDSVSISDPSNSVVSFSASGSDGDEKNATYQCTITDSAPSVLHVNVNSIFLFGTIL